MVNLTTRIKSFMNPIGMAKQLAPANTEKGIYGNSLASMFGYGGGLDSRNHDFTASEHGAAQASQLLVDVAAGINVWEQWLDGITWHIKDNSTGTTLITTDERVIDENAKGARLFRAIKAYRKRYGHSYWKSIAMSDWITGETYIRRVRNRSKIPSELQWLNPLATEPFAVSGVIQYFTYSNDDMQEVGYRISKEDMAYRKMRRNIFDDLRGFSPVLSVIDEANLSRNVKRAFRQYFRNGMILGGIVSPSGENSTFSLHEENRVEEMLTRNNRGVNNAHSWIISPKPINAQTFDTKDAGKDIEVLSTLRGSIMMAIGVPEELAGNPTEATYENLEATQYGWYKFKGIPYAKDIAEYHNNQIIPFLDGSGVYLEPELSKYEIERPEVVSQDVTASVISLHTAQIKRGQTDADEKLRDIYIVNGRPMHRDVIVKLANTMPAEEIEKRANAEESLANAVAKPIEAQATATEAEQPEPVIEAPAPPEVVEDSEEPQRKSITIAHGDHDHVIPVADSDAYTVDKALAELKTWTKFRKSDPSRDFVAKHLLGDIADSLRAATDSDSAFDSAFETVKGWQKAIQAIRIDFEDDFDELMSRARAEGNNFGRRQWSTAMRAIIRRACTRAYSDGLIAGGVLDGELSESDGDILASHIADQSRYVTSLGEKIFKTEDGISDALAEQKAPMWFNKSVQPMFDAGRESADANGMYEWVLGNTEEHCTDCLRLDGQRHRLKSWRRKGLTPQSDVLACNGFNCDCKLVKVSAKARGRF